ncbi:uncharacterized protein LOC135389380 [Ornithodoros turicata]|uniref:uncharacterized protein LOC135389380 n=1 Tax=Ornithodoros turicata TaxID=34597 RepID=UPI0031391489
MDRLKQKRAVVGASVTKLITDVDALLRVQSPAAGELQTKLDLLKSKEETLQSDGSATTLVGEKICTAISQISQKLKEIQRTTLRPDSPTRAVLVPAMQHQGATKVKLPKIEIPKFNGDLMNWMTFWDQFESTIQKNETLHNNYDAAIEILNQRFNQRQQIVDQHLNRLLNLLTVADPRDYVHLRELYDEVQVTERDLQALKVEQNQYGVMVLSVLRKSVPKQVVLDYNGKYQEGTPAGKTELNNFLGFLRGEIESRQKSEYPVDARLSESRLKVSKDRRPLIRHTTEAHNVLSARVQIMTSRVVAAHSVSTKKERHLRERDAVSNVLNDTTDHVSVEQRLESDAPAITGTISRFFAKESSRVRPAETPTIHFLTYSPQQRHANWKHLVSGVQSFCRPLASGRRRILLDGGSQRTFIRESLSHDLQCEPVGEKNLSICSFGCTPSRRKCRRAGVWLRSQYSREEISVEAFEIPEISANLMHDPDSKLIIALHEKGMPVADLVMFDVRSSDNIHILVGSDLYWSIVTGESQRIDDNLFAVNTIFG